MPSTKIDPKIRQVAVLLASVDSQSARQLLSQLPTVQAKQVRHAMVNLGQVSPEERRQALAMFQQMNQATGKGGSTNRRMSPAEAALNDSGEKVDSFELSDASQRSNPPKREIDFERSTDVYRAPTSADDEVGTEATDELHQWHQMDCHDLSELLAQERPIVVAVVLNQIPVPLAASLLQLLPSELAMDAIAVLPRLQSTPNDVLKEIHQNLHQRINDYQLPKKSSEQNLKRLQAILDVAQVSFRDACKKNIAEHEPMIARRLGWVVPAEPGNKYESVYSDPHLAETAPDPVSMPVSKTAFAVSKEAEKREAQQFNPAEATLRDLNDDHSVNRDILPFAMPSGGGEESHGPNSFPSIRMSFDELGSLSISDLATVLRASEPTVILLAISGASAEFCKKVEAMLHPKDVKRLNAKLSQMGPIQLSDIDKAQRHLCEIATGLLASGRIGSLVSMTITAAA